MYYNYDMEIRKLDVKEITEALKNKNKFKDVVIEAIEYLINKEKNSGVIIIGVRELVSIIKEMLNLKSNKYNKRIEVKVGLALKDLGIQTFRAGVENRKEFVISKTEFEMIKNANKK
jgi:NADH:ubiquinone oxidoreductase subunit C